jgi:hypothetical protein
MHTGAKGLNGCAIRLLNDDIPPISLASHHRLGSWIHEDTKGDGLQGNEYLFCSLFDFRVGMIVYVYALSRNTVYIAFRTVNMNQDHSTPVFQHVTPLIYFLIPETINDHITLSASRSSTPPLSLLITIMKVDKIIEPVFHAC